MNTAPLWRLAFGVWRLAFGPAQRRFIGAGAIRSRDACGGPRRWRTGQAEAGAFRARKNAKRQTSNAKLQTWLLIATALLPLVTRGAESAKGYDAYKLVRTRNIFDPNRKAVRIEAPRPSGPARPRSSTFTLTGTMVREGRSLAFFSGSRSEFSKVISIGDSVANFKIIAIEPSQVELEHEGKKMTLAIGKPFQIEGKPGDPVEAEPAEETPAAGNATDGTAAPAPVAPAAAPAGGDAKSEILRKMMERRAKEMGK